MAGMQLQGCQCNRGGTSTEPHGGGQNIGRSCRTTSICMHSDNFRRHIFGDHHSLGSWCILLWPPLQFLVFMSIDKLPRTEGCLIIEVFANIKKDYLLENFNW